MHSPHPNNFDTEPNNTNNGYVRSFPEDFSFDNTNAPVHMPINLQAQSHAQNFLPSASDNVDMTSMDIMDYGNTGNYTGNYAPYEGNPSVFYYTQAGNIDTMNGQLNPLSHGQVEIHTNSSCPLPVPFHTYCGSSDSYPDTSIPYSDTTNNSLTDNNFQHLGMINNSSSTSYIFTHEPTGSGYVVTKVEYTQSVLGKMSAADFNQMLATT
ncbi:4936_t:CDS:1 [Paraglomus brasilianum]|uniref:4936_t:CDS:1 n=1 Tax=Paraglomus brasilianum TaxID=144538 RepID=A0A9N9CH95_9GLOM|nr:4936_t:CDS:1 [Paraglomus brasilianum]